MQVNILEAKNKFSSLILAAEHDEEVVIARNGVPVAKIVKYTARRVAAPGAWKGRSAYAADWNSAETNAEAENLMLSSCNAPVA